MFSLVAAAFNVAPYLDDFFASVIAQTYGLTGVELIVVNDGSTDETRQIIDRWAARYPKLIRAIHQSNGGVAAARNAGMAQAKGVWIGFPDPDDILHPDYLSELAQAVDPEATQIAIVANLVRYIEETDTYADTHPMRYRFTKGLVSRPVHKTRDMILQSVSHVVFRWDCITAHGLRFDPAIQPTFEDGYFANSLLIHEADKIISFVPKAVYYYRKRAALGSAVDGSRNDPRWYTTQIETGYLSLIDLARDTLGHVPPFIQINCLYSMMWRFRYLVDQPERTALLDASTQVALRDNLARVFARIDKDVIMRFHRAGCSEMHKVALLARYGKGLRNPQRVQPVNLGEGLFEFQWYQDPVVPVVLQPFINDAPAKIVTKTQEQSLFLGEPYVCQSRVQIRVTDGDGVHFVAADGRKTCFRDKGLDLGAQIDTAQLKQLPLSD